jgi:hypothetical protein
MPFMKSVTQSLGVAQCVAQGNAALGQSVPQSIDRGKRLVDSLDVASGDRSEFRDRATMSRNDETFASLDTLEQCGKMSLGLVGSDLVHECFKGNVIDQSKPV